MQTIRFTMNVRINPDQNTSIATEHIVSNAEEARQAGREANLIVNRFLEGFAEELAEEESE